MPWLFQQYAYCANLPKNNRGASTRCASVESQGRLHGLQVTKSTTKWRLAPKGRSWLLPGKPVDPISHQSHLPNRFWWPPTSHHANVGFWSFYTVRGIAQGQHSHPKNYSSTTSDVHGDTISYKLEFKNIGFWLKNVLPQLTTFHIIVKIGSETVQLVMLSQKEKLSVTDKLKIVKLSLTR